MKPFVTGHDTVDGGGGQGLSPFELRLKQCMLETVSELYRSAANRRLLSLPNTLRLFERRWYGPGLTEEEMNRGRRLGRAFIEEFYRMHQPFRGELPEIHPVDE